MEAKDETAFSQDDFKRFYDADTTEVNQPMRKLLEKYSQVPPKDVVRHVNNIRKQGFAVHPYPCIGQYRFLNLTLPTHPLYDTVLRRLREDPSTRYIDLACCFGQDLRQLAADGVKHEQLIGVDMQAAFINLGYDLFQDRSTLKSKFFLADIFKGSEQGEAWTSLEQVKADVVHCSAFFHIFTLEDQIHTAKNIAQLVRPNGVIVGRQAGSIDPGAFHSDKGGYSNYMHDVTTFRQMWDHVGRETGTKWQVEGSMDLIGVGEQGANGGSNLRRLLFTVTRLE